MALFYLLNALVMGVTAAFLTGTPQLCTAVAAGIFALAGLVRFVLRVRRIRRMNWIDRVYGRPQPVVRNALLGMDNSVATNARGDFSFDSVSFGGGASDCVSDSHFGGGDSGGGGASASWSDSGSCDSGGGGDGGGGGGGD